MPTQTKRIGLSLGADICWPICYEEIFRRLKLKVDLNGRELEFACERVSIEPFDLEQDCPYDVVIDRLTHWYHTSREWIKKSIIVNDLYVFNNPWAVQSMEKATTYSAMLRLGLPVPKTLLLPPKEYEPSPDLESTLSRYAKLFDLGALGAQLGYPLFMKPYDGGAWVGVSKIDDEEALRRTYDESGKRVMHLQRAVHDFDLFVRCVGLGPQFRMVRYDPSAPLHARYEVAHDFLSEEEASLLRDITITINGFFGWDFNSCECLRKDGTFYPIDFANPCPDSQVTSLHYHFPWLIMANLRWSLFCAATDKAMQRTLDWEPYFKIAATDQPYRDKVRAYARISEQRMEVDRFEEFCSTHLQHLPEVAWEFFGSAEARDAVHRKVSAMYPAHEIDSFTEHFWGLIQQWRADQRRDPVPSAVRSGG